MLAMLSYLARFRNFRSASALRGRGDPTGIECAVILQATRTAKSASTENFWKDGYLVLPCKYIFKHVNHFFKIPQTARATRQINRQARSIEEMARDLVT